MASRERTCPDEAGQSCGLLHGSVLTYCPAGKDDAGCGALEQRRSLEEKAAAVHSKNRVLKVAAMLHITASIHT